ncbi:hypothetical protein LPN04_04090 [Rugamonas sp. A1-17]|nr:hypothetical protein [Rugamonas sp. A1-17]
MNQIQNSQSQEKSSLRELSMEEIDAVAGGVQWECTVTKENGKPAKVSCTIKGNL